MNKGCQPGPVEHWHWENWGTWCRELWALGKTSCTYYLVTVLVLLGSLVRAKRKMVVAPWRGGKPSASMTCFMG